MRVTLAGFLTDHVGRVLLQQTGPRSLEPVTCALAPGDDPVPALAAAFRAATGLFVLPVRLVGVYMGRGDALTLSYRCTLRGGELEVPAGQPAAGFFDTQPRLRGLSAAHERFLDDALHHDGGPAWLARSPEGMAARLGLAPAPAGEGAAWPATTRLIVLKGDEVLWTRPAPADAWRLPAGAVAAGDAPWQTAATMQRALGLDTAAAPTLRLIVANGELAFVFLLPAGAGPIATGRGEKLFAAPGNAPAEFDPVDAGLAAEVLAAPPGTVARRGPAGAARA